MLNPRVQLIIDMSKFCHTGLNFGIDWLDKEASLKHIVSLLLAVLAAPPKILIAPRFLRLRNRMEA